MADTLYIRGEASTDLVEAVVLSTEGRIVQRFPRGTLGTLRSAAVSRHVVMLLPAGEVITTEAELPPASPARIRQMLPYSLEDTFADDVERLQFAAGRRLDQGRLTVSVIARHRLDHWLDLLADAEIKTDAVYSEADGVPDTPSTLTLMLEGERVYGRRPGHAPFMFEGLDVAQAHALLQSQSEDDADLQHVVVYADETAQPVQASAVAELRSRVASLDLKSLAQGALPHLAATLSAMPGTNLLQGLYAPKSNWRALAQPWQTAAGVLVAAVLVALLAQAAELVVLQREDRALTQALAARCTELAGTDRLSACATTVRRRLSEAGADPVARDESFLSTLAAVAEFRPDNSLIEALSYRNDVMDLQLVAPSVPSLDSFAQQIADTDRFVARIQSANPSESGVEGRVQVVGAGNR